MIDEDINAEAKEILQTAIDVTFDAMAAVKGDNICESMLAGLAAFVCTQNDFNIPFFLSEFEKHRECFVEQGMAEAKQI